MSKNYKYDKPIIFCDESGFSGNFKRKTNITNYLSQRVFIIAGILIKNEKEYKTLENKYKLFLNKHNFDKKELKSEIFGKNNNKILKDFINTFCVNSKNIYISVLDKKYSLIIDAFYTLLDNKISVENETLYYIFDELSEEEQNEIIEKFNILLNFEKNENTYKKFFKEMLFYLKKTHFFEVLKTKISWRNIEKNLEKYHEGKWLSINHIDTLFYLVNLIDFYELNPQVSAKKFNIVYDINDELKQVNDYYLKLTDFYSLTFANSEDEPLIQLADNYSRVYGRYFSMILNNENIPKILKPLNINYYKKLHLFCPNKSKNNLIIQDDEISFSFLLQLMANLN